MSEKRDGFNLVLIALMIILYTYFSELAKKKNKKQYCLTKAKKIRLLRSVILVRGTENRLGETPNNEKQTKEEARRISDLLVRKLTFIFFCLGYTVL